MKVLNGEYDLAYEHSAPVILDVGANVGAFAIWALQRWPGCHVHCYEPIPDNFDLLVKNLAYAGEAVELKNVAVSSVIRSHMYLGKNNCGEASFFKGPEQSHETVRIVSIPPTSLPEAQILKMDVEGAEMEILDVLTGAESGGVRKPLTYDAVLFEYHSDEHRRVCDQLLYEYVLVSGEITGTHCGVLKYLHKRIAPIFRYEA